VKKKKKALIVFTKSDQSRQRNQSSNWLGPERCLIDLILGPVEAGNTRMARHFYHEKWLYSEREIKTGVYYLMITL
jgi:hypothetical protein